MNGFRKFDDLFWKYMLAYKKRTIFTIFGITLLFYGAGTVYTSVYQAYYETNSKKYGNYEAAGTVNPEEYQKMKKLDYIEAMLLYQTNTQTIELEDTERWVEVRQMENFENPIFSYDLIDGHYPEQPDELMLDEYQAEYFNVRTGDVLELQGYEYWYGTVRIGDGEQAFRYLQEHTEYDADGMPTEESLQIEDLEKRTIKTRYRIAGIYESDQEYNDFLIESTPFLSLLDQEKEYREMEVCVQFRNHKNHLQQLAKEGIFLEENEWVTEYLKGYNNSVMDPLLQYILFLPTRFVVHSKLNMLRKPCQNLSDSKRKNIISTAFFRIFMTVYVCRYNPNNTFVKHRHYYILNERSSCLIYVGFNR